MLLQGSRGGDGTAPACQHLAIGQHYAGARDILPGGDGLQGIFRRLLVIEHHGGL